MFAFVLLLVAGKSVAGTTYVSGKEWSEKSRKIEKVDYVRETLARAGAIALKSQRHEYQYQTIRISRNLEGEIEKQ